MANLTESQANLLRLANQLSQSLMTGDRDPDFSLDLPGLDFDFNLDIGEDASPDTPTPPATTPDTLTEVLLRLRNEQVEITTPFGTVTGTLLVVESDYVVVVEASGAQVLVRIDKIELVSEL
ncbi:DUF2642 domain-containing protein [Halobacillus hunanensis]|uniref:DUF2642 domain-containing protein n=1 Tax=Halobacillus hunanensis TaxID=578214 RepID=UPI001591094A|nr:DUF2642 domain-containing protein [Halobacillus hunanensis]